MNFNINNKSKNELRTYSKSVRSKNNIQQVSTYVYKQLIEIEEYKGSQNMLLYYPFGSEISLTECFMDLTKNWYLPRVDYNDLFIHKYTLNDELKPNKWGILEPCKKSEVVDPQIIDLIVVPALMADEKGFRLGYGAGFYDRFNKYLSKKCIKVTCILDELYVKALPADDWDENMDIIITEKRVIKIK